ncbi:protein melted-like isoform X2 [Photinus pyralis]|uniref:protein melted-like isoform X2 n=1 Tax=Photinus pyralis TaxID=7054 RepID=UPI0012674A92|nr:protein melted-like isoform X2 [Photinus pyralis]
MTLSKELNTTGKMHELFMQVLKNRDLSKAGDLFSVTDGEIVNDLTLVLNEITTIASQPDYAHNDNDQSVVEICVTRVTSCIRETGTVEQHCEALVTLLESCLHHNLQLTSRDEDPPHAKISSDIISCIFLNYGKKSVMQRALSVAVKFLHKGNKELSRNMASYLSLAAIEHASLLSPHVQPIMDSIISGNYPLCRVLAQIYEVSPEPLQGHAMALVSLLPHCDNQEKLALLHLFSLIAKDNPTLLEASVPQLCEYLNSSTTAAPTLQVFLNMAQKNPALLADHVGPLKLTAQRYPHTVCLAAQVISAVGKLSKDRAQDALNFVLEYLPKADRGSQGTLLREATLLCSSYPVLFTDKVLAGVRQRHHTSSNQIGHTHAVNQNNHVTSGGVTIVKVGGNTQQTAPTSQGGYTRRAKLGNSRSTGRLTSNNNHQSSSVGGLHKSMTRLSSSQQINVPVSNAPPVAAPVPPPLSNNVMITNNKWVVPNSRVSSGGVTVTTISPPRIHRPHSQGPMTLLTPVGTNHSSQARSPHALSSRDASVTSLKHCWDMLKCENKTFLTLVTSAFPCSKDQEMLLNELRHSGFFDVFQLCPGNIGGSSSHIENGIKFQWGCFLCAHPERAVGFLRGDTQPVIEGQLKEKKGKWKLFRRWRTRYFTLSGAHLSCKGSSGGESIDVNQIRSVKVSRGARNIPKAFEIFTGNQSLILKPKDGKNAEEWVQCLSIVVAHSHAKELPAKTHCLIYRGYTFGPKDFPFLVTWM